MEHAVHCRRFADFDEYREHLRHWDMECSQVSAGSLAITQQYFDAGDLILDRTTFAPASVSRSARRRGWCSLVIDLSPKRWCGIDVPAGSVRLLPSQSETNVVSHQPWDAICVTVRQSELARWAPRLADFIDRDWSPERGILASNGVAVAAFRKWVETLFTVRFNAVGGGNTDIWAAAIRDRTEQHVLRILMYPAAAKPGPRINRAARYSLALAALRKIHGNAERHHTVTELVEELGVGHRALEYAFRSVFGLSPSQYMLVERLNRARHDLRLAPTTRRSVTSIAFDHDFEHPSRFARQYARLFGELPSDTLRSARGALRQAGNVPGLRIAGTAPLREHVDAKDLSG